MLKSFSQVIVRWENLVLNSTLSTRDRANDLQIAAIHHSGMIRLSLQRNEEINALRQMWRQWMMRQRFFCYYVFSFAKLIIVYIIWNFRFRKTVSLVLNNFYSINSQMLVVYIPSTYRIHDQYLNLSFICKKKYKKTLYNCNCSRFFTSWNTYTWKFQYQYHQPVWLCFTLFCIFSMNYEGYKKTYRFFLFAKIAYIVTFTVFCTNYL